MKKIGPIKVKIRSRHAVMAISQMLAIAKSRYLEVRKAIPSNEISEFEKTMNGQLEPPIHIFTSTPTNDPKRHNVSFSEPYTEALKYLRMQTIPIDSDASTTESVKVQKSTLTPWQYKRALNLHMAKSSIEHAETLHLDLGKYNAAIVSISNALMLIGAAGVPSFDAVEKKARSKTGKAGGDKKKEKYASLKEKAWQLAKEKAPSSGKWQSMANCAAKILNDVQDYAKENGIPLLSGDRPEDRVAEYLSRMSEAEKATLFASKRPPLTSKHPPLTS
ncbi:hypothetical protein [Aquitalea denitrificans]|uniref:hypothetical protein n=1 Tax=Aquitalea denitrificans TaxID=519081 RepID=UPI00135B5EEA|nr:hypothetical protein [Aquitalea denitrificans]